MRVILVLLLPKYEESFRMLAVLLPVCVFDGKMQMLNTTYLKVLRKERALMFLNIGTLLFSAYVCWFGAYFVKDMRAVAGAMTASVAVRSVAANLYLSRLINCGMGTACLWEIGLSSVFIISNLFFTPLTAFSAYLICYIGYLYFTRAEIKRCLRGLRNLVQS